MEEIKKTKYLIIGNSAGAIGAAEAIRQVDKKGTLTIVSDEPYPAYSRPLISEHLADHRPLEAMLFRPPDFYKVNNIETILGQTAKKLDVNNRIIELADGQKIAWEKLLLATGGVPIVPPVGGGSREGVFTFTTLNDAKAIDQYLNHFTPGTVKAVVIGGGLIGVSVTEALLRRKVEVAIVEAKDRILNMMLDEETSAIEDAALRQLGIEIITNNTVSRINSYLGNNVTSVTLNDGRPIPCQMVIQAIGVRPRLDLTSGTGIKTNRGIVVDDHMATTLADTYACGDVAEAMDFVFCENRLTPIWPNAYLGGRIAGFNMAGQDTEYQGGTAMNTMKYFGLSVASAGMAIPPDSSYEVLSAKRDHTYRKVILKNGVITGVIFVGNIEKAGIIFNLMKNKVNVNAFKKALISDDFGMASLPEALWREWLEITPPATKTAQPEKVAAGK